MKWNQKVAAVLAATWTTALCVLPAAGYSGQTVPQYPDVPSAHWAYSDVMNASEQGWFNGYPDGSFGPTNSITRAEAVKVFGMFLHLTTPQVTQSSFYDVSSTAWYAPYVEAGKDLIPTYPNEQGKLSFQPEVPITREDAIYGLVTALGYAQDTTFVDENSLNSFRDQDKISAGIRPYVALAVQEGLVSGRSDHMIDAKAALSRAEFAALLCRASRHGFRDTGEAKIELVSIAPSVPQELAVGESFTVSATAVYSDKSTQEYANVSPYNADNNDVVSIQQNQITAAKIGTCTIRFHDHNLKEKSIQVTVREIAAPLSLKFDEYVSSTSKGTAVISGTVVDHTAGIVTLTCNGQKVDLHNGKFSKTVSLNTGNNSFTFLATNSAGGSVSKTAVIARTSDWGETVDGEFVLPDYEGYYDIDFSETSGNAFQKLSKCTDFGSFLFSGNTQNCPSGTAANGKKLEDVFLLHGGDRVHFVNLPKDSQRNQMIIEMYSVRNTERATVEIYLDGRYAGSLELGGDEYGDYGRKCLDLRGATSLDLSVTTDSGDASVYADVWIGGVNG